MEKSKEGKTPHSGEPSRQQSEEMGAASNCFSSISLRQTSNIDSVHLWYSVHTVNSHLAPLHYQILMSSVYLNSPISYRPQEPDSSKAEFHSKSRDKGPVYPGGAAKAHVGTGIKDPASVWSWKEKAASIWQTVPPSKRYASYYLFHLLWRLDSQGASGNGIQPGRHTDRHRH